MVSWLHWCPNGCGKSVQYVKSKDGKDYFCHRCLLRFHKETIIKFQEGEKK